MIPGELIRRYLAKWSVGWGGPVTKYCTPKYGFYRDPAGIRWVPWSVKILVCPGGRGYRGSPGYHAGN